MDGRTNEDKAICPSISFQTGGIIRSSTHRYQTIHQVSRLQLQQFLRNLLTRERCLNLQRAITYEIFFRIYPKVNQVIYSSLPINSPSFKSLALTVFLRYFADKIKMPKITKGHNSISIFQNFIQKLIRVPTHHYKSIHQISWI